MELSPKDGYWHAVDGVIARVLFEGVHMDPDEQEPVVALLLDAQKRGGEQRSAVATHCLTSIWRQLKPLLDDIPQPSDP